MPLDWACCELKVLTWGAQLRDDTPPHKSIRHYCKHKVER